jgi:ComF family protein
MSRGLGLFTFLLPERCAACDAWGRAPLCAGCETIVQWIVPPMCERCGRPTPVATDRCRDCRGRDLGYVCARSAAVYTGPAREALKAFKLLGERRTARSLAARMAAAAHEIVGDQVTWVPSTRRGEAERGFVPAEALARPLARLLGLPAARLLSKVRETRDQTGLSRVERRSNLGGAFAAIRLVPGRVILVDDVMTTGATAEACTLALLRGGAREVRVVTFARAL